MEAGAKGCLVVIAGKLMGERHRPEKCKAGHIKYCGEPRNLWMDRGFAVAKLKPGVIGVTVEIMDPRAKLPDEIEIKQPSAEYIAAAASFVRPVPAPVVVGPEPAPPLPPTIGPEGADERPGPRSDGRRPSESRKDQGPPEKHRAHLDDYVRGATGRARRGSAGKGRDGGDLSEPAETRAHRPRSRGPALDGPEPGPCAGPGRRRDPQHARARDSGR